MKIMFSSDAILGFFFIFLICIGLMGNLVLFILYIDTFLTQSCLKKPIDVIFIHLTLVNVLTILFKLIPDVMPSFGERYFLDDVGQGPDSHKIFHKSPVFFSFILNCFGGWEPGQRLHPGRSGCVLSAASCPSPIRDTLLARWW